MIILNPSLDDEAIRSVNGRVSELIRSRGGEADRPELWGRRKLAYPLSHSSEGFYSLLRFRAEPSAIADLDRVLGIEDNVMRHKIVRLPDGLATGGPTAQRAPSAAIAAD
jgi:small subunit ribosomal protein S6